MLNLIDEGKVVDKAYLDFNEVFNTVDHGLHIGKYFNYALHK